ncbi:clostripain-related cysteine peptidase [Bacteroides cellulosilyticus]|uniref:clostripain-related cysteine peptidase n=1 Tax=Bacteroides cellulosilyticus TaxID=246787 RepID=UPI001E3055FF|nr:clostripain-related cysteine peptidase [Bacteroides cellulosilyticus]
MRTLPLRYCIKTPVKEKAKRTTVRTAQNGVLTEDPTFDPGEDFAITDPKELTDFIRWSVEKYPNRHYLLVIGGHGKAFVPYEDEDATSTKTRATLYDDHKYMSSAQLGNAIRQSGQNLDALIFNSCQQGNIEMLAEWEGTADYLLSTPFMLPDFGYDYASLIGDLQQGRSVEEALARTAHRAINLWQEFHNQEECGMVTQVSRIRDLTPLWETMRQIIGAMNKSIEDRNFTTDAPAVYGQPYGQGYARALVSKYVGNEDDFFEYNRPTFALDIVGFFHAAYVQSGNMSLAPYINRLDEILADVIVTHRQTNGKHDFIYLVFNALSIYDKELDGQLYRKCRFDKLTGWRDFYDSLTDFVYNYEEECEILTPISEHIVGRWDLKEMLRKRFNEWIPAGNEASDLGVMIFRPNNEIVKVNKAGGYTRLGINHWIITEGNKIKLTDFDVDAETDILQLTENDLVLMETVSYSKMKVHFQRANDMDKTIAERMVGKWSLSKRYEKVNGEWVEVENLPVECWSEFLESGLLNSYTRLFTTSEGVKNDNMPWRVHEETGTVMYINPADRVPRFFRIALEDNDNTMIMNSSENFNPELEEQTSTEYKDILIRN